MEKELIKKLQRWLVGNQAAVGFCLDIVAIAHIWDDLIDKDKPVTDDQINGLMFTALIGIQANPFYSQYRDDLRPVMASAICQWQTANELEKSDDTNDHDKAFVLRASILSIVQFCAMLIGGAKWAADCGVEIWRFYHETKDSFLGGPENA
jgi:hypothetical protein